MARVWARGGRVRSQVKCWKIEIGPGGPIGCHFNKQCNKISSYLKDYSIKTINHFVKIIIMRMHQKIPRYGRIFFFGLAFDLEK